MELNVAADACVRCGRCAEVCVSGAVVMGDSGPEKAHDHCIVCGHCVAVCPEEALDNSFCPLTGQKPLPVPGKPVVDPETAELFLRSRHSERCFSSKPVPRPLVEKMLNVARFAPTGGNTQGISYLAIDDRTVLDALAAAVFAWGREERAKETRLGKLMERFEERKFREGRDTALWNAPCLVIAVAQPERFIPSARDNAVIALVYAQVYAASLGLGTCWAGLVEAMAAAKFPAFMERVAPYGERIAGAFMVGYPKYPYSRVVDREPLAVTWFEG